MHKAYCNHSYKTLGHMTITRSAFKCLDNLDINEPVLKVHTPPLWESTNTASLVCMHGEDAGNIVHDSGNCGYVLKVRTSATHF